MCNLRSLPHPGPEQGFLLCPIYENSYQVQTVILTLSFFFLDSTSRLKVNMCGWKRPCTVPVQPRPSCVSQLSPEVPRFPAGKSSRRGDFVQAVLREGTVEPKWLCSSARFKTQDPVLMYPCSESPDPQDERWRPAWTTARSPRWPPKICSRECRWFSLQITSRAMKRLREMHRAFFFK